MKSDDTYKRSSVKITLRANEGIDSALKRFKRVCNNQGVFTLVKRSAFYEKPSEKRRRKERERVKNIRKMLALEAGPATRKRKKKKRITPRAGQTASSGSSSTAS